MIKILLFLGITFFANPVYAACTGPVGVAGDLMYNTTYDVFQGCTARGWYAFHEAGSPDACASSPSPGDVCSDGSVYAGLSPDGNVAMFTTPADAPSLMTWNNGTSNWFDTSMVNCLTVTPGSQASCRTGEANTTLLVGVTGSHAPYNAAVYCDGLTAHGHSDWYLPAQDELDVLYDNRAAIGGFNVTGSFPAGWYWSSSESGGSGAPRQRFSDGAQSSSAKSSGVAVRCVRR